MSKSMKVLVLAGVLSLGAASAVQAGGHSTSGDFHANAAPACGSTQRCPVLAGDTGPGSPGDDTSRAELVIGIHSMMAGGKPIGSDFHASAAPACGDQCPVLAGDGPPGVGEGNGRSMASNTTGGHLILASIKAGTGDF